MLTFMVFLWWLSGAATMLWLMYQDHKTGGDITLGECLLIGPWAFAGLFLPAIVIFIDLQRKGVGISIKQFFDRVLIRGRK